VLDIIRAKSEEAEKAALAQLQGGLSGKIIAASDRLMDICAHLETHIDFPEDDVETGTMEEISDEIKEVRERLSRLAASYEEGRLLREGLKTAIVGRPNVGKSSLLNALLGEERAIVAETPGTTRDVISEYISIGGFALRIMDTAGIRESRDMAEKEGVSRSLRAIEEADLVICVLDGSLPPGSEDFEVLLDARGKSRRVIAVVNKSDLPAAWSPEENRIDDFVRLSAKTGEGVERLKLLIKKTFMKGASAEPSEAAIVTNLRHRLALDRAVEGLGDALESLGLDMPLEIVSVGLRDALHALGEIVGTANTEDILDRIFSQFCIGK
jgi:tRNA modification GTPase